jgi:SAM-dependent methyltransferase
MKKINYPKGVTESFSLANNNINYCVFFFKKYLSGNVLEVGAGNGDFSDKFITTKINSLTMTELDDYNFSYLKEKYKKFKKIKVVKKNIFNIKKKFDAILYLHVLEHIKNDNKELKKASELLKKNGYLIILVPAHQKLFGNLDSSVGHYRRYNKEFFSGKNFKDLKKIRFKFLDFVGFFLYYLNNFFFKKENTPSKYKILIWDKIFTPLTIVLDYIINYSQGKCILAVFKK